MKHYTIVVPTRDSAKWIGAFCAHYQAMGLRPLYLVDSRSRDSTVQTLKQMGADIRQVTPQADRVESMLAFAQQEASSEWIIRFDDDELPSMALVRWLDESIRGVREPSIAFSRRDVMMRDGRLCYSRGEHYYFHQNDPTYLNPQWRGFKPSQVEWTDAIHTPGFAVKAFADAPSSAYFVHFDWMLRSTEERIEKMKRYERQAAGAGWSFAQFYLPERHHPDACRWTRMDTQEFDRLAAEITSWR